jgi:fatty-acyl-CoA synthase
MAEKYPDSDCVCYRDKPFRYTYSGFLGHVNAVAKGFLALGIRKGDHVAIWSTNYPEWIVTMFATATIGAVMVTVNTNYKTAEAEYLLRQSDTNTLILMKGFKDSDYVGSVYELAPEMIGARAGEWESRRLPRLKRVIYLDGGEPDGMISWDTLAKLGESVSDGELEAAYDACGAHDVVNIQYTSGTTGFPKGVMLTHYNIVNDGMYIGDNMALTNRDRLCIPVPFFHCFGCVLGITACVTHGAAMVPVDHFNPAVVMETIQAERCTAVHGVPTMFNMMLSHPDFDKYDFSSLRTGIMAGSPCPVKDMTGVIERMNMREVTICYGLTEASPVCTQTNAAEDMERRVSTIGRSLPNMECAVVDPETFEELPDGVPGEFVVRGFNVMKGYYNMPEATAQVITPDGWLRSGDVCNRDADGYFRVEGRIKDMIIRGGENIYPMELENSFRVNPKIHDVQVVSVPDERFGEEVCACIQLKPGGEMDADEFRNYTLERIARHKVPRYVVFVDEMPMNAAGKIQKYKLRQLAAARLGLAPEGE